MTTESHGEPAALRQILPTCCQGIRNSTAEHWLYSDGTALTAVRAVGAGGAHPHPVANVSSDLAGRDLPCLCQRRRAARQQIAAWLMGAGFSWAWAHGLQSTLRGSSLEQAPAAHRKAGPETESDCECLCRARVSYARSCLTGSYPALP